MYDISELLCKEAETLSEDEFAGTGELHREKDVRNLLLMPLIDWSY